MRQRPQAGRRRGRQVLFRSTHLTPALPGVQHNPQPPHIEGGAPDGKAMQGEAPGSPAGGKPFWAGQLATYLAHQSPAFQLCRCCCGKSLVVPQFATALRRRLGPRRHRRSSSPRPTFSRPLFVASLHDCAAISTFCSSSTKQAANSVHGVITSSCRHRSTRRRHGQVAPPAARSCGCAAE